MQAGGVARRDEARALRFPFGRIGQQLRAHQARQGQIVEKHLHELFAREAEHEIVLAHPIFAALVAPTTPATTGRAADVITAHVVAIARVNRLTHPTLPMTKHRLGDIAARQRHVFALLDVADAAARDGFAHRIANLLAVAAQEALAVADGLVLARQPPIDDLLEHLLSWGRVGQLLLRTRRYHSHKRRTCLAV